MQTAACWGTYMANGGQYNDRLQGGNWTGWGSSNRRARYTYRPSYSAQPRQWGYYSYRPSAGAGSYGGGYAAQPHRGGGLIMDPAR